jgi:hypothetical protein
VYVPDRAEDASTKQPGSVIDRSQVTESWAGTPLLSCRVRDGVALAQSAESHTIRFADSTTTCIWPGSNAQLPAAVETA